jgi:hypothetical protein
MADWLAGWGIGLAGWLVGWLGWLAGLAKVTLSRNRVHTRVTLGYTLGYTLGFQSTHSDFKVHTRISKYTLVEK